MLRIGTEGKRGDENVSYYTDTKHQYDWYHIHIACFVLSCGPMLR